MAEKTITVIVCQCTPDGKTYGETCLIATCQTLDGAMTLGEKERTLDRREKGSYGGICVIVRPNYNETDDSGRFFREWRSFNSLPFKESRWKCG